MRYFLFVLTVAAAVLAVPARPAPACGGALPHGKSFEVVSETALIVYDRDAGVEHFVRQANFRTDADEAGFLVPTPTQPDLGGVAWDLFFGLRNATAPRRIPRGVVRVVSDPRTFRRVSSTVGAAPVGAAPLVLEEKTVAGYDATVLRAEDPDGLKAWLAERKFDARPELMDWLGWYVEHKWIITAFKLSKASRAAGSLPADAVRMSFRTDAPFYPYREPADMRAPDRPRPARSLRVFVLADARYDGTLGRAGRWAGGCPKHDVDRVFGQLDLRPAEADALRSRPWVLTEFEDESTPRPGTDEVYLRPAADQSAAERPPVYYDQIEYVDPLLTADQRDRLTWMNVAIVGTAAVGLAAVRLSRRGGPAATP